MQIKSLFFGKNKVGDVMKGEKDLKNYRIRTDLVVDILEDSLSDDNIIIRERNNNDIKVLDVEILNNNNKLNKKVGKYITISYDDITDKDNKERLEKTVVSELKDILCYLDITIKSKCLVIGLGNRNSTPDSLGPKVIDSILVTKYLYDIKSINVDERYRNVSAFSPGVTGVTGIESSDIILGIVEKTKPDFLIIIDALASSSMDRVNRTIQITTSGISPGSGVYNNRGELSIETLGIPVISIGIPTVIEAFVLVSDTIKYLFKNFSYNKENYSTNKLKPIGLKNYINYPDNLSLKEKKQLLGEIGLLSEDDVKELIFEVLTPIGYNMMVTPKEIDFVMEKTSLMLASAINKSLHQDFDR